MADIHADGVDVANHQMGLDWRNLAKAGMTFGWFKLTEGVQYTDPWADEHHASAQLTSMVDGAYQFARPDTNTPRADAEWFCHVLTSRGLHEQGHLPPVLDIEDPREGFRLTDENVVGASSIRAWCRDWLSITAEKTGRYDLVTYASASFITDRLRGEGFLPGEDMRLWVAHYGVTPGRPAYLTNKVIAHQYRSDGMVAGWPKGLDFNALLVPLSSLVSGVPVPNPGGGGGGVVPPPNGENRSAGDGFWWNLPPEEYYGPITGPRESHGGYYPAEREWVRKIQKALIRGGHARRNNGHPVSDPNGGWADGRYEQATVDAVKRFQAANSLIQTGNVWPDDWERLPLLASD